MVDPLTGRFSNLLSPLSTHRAKLPDAPSVGAAWRYKVAALVTVPVAVIFGSSMAKDATRAEVVEPETVTAAELSIKVLKKFWLEVAVRAGLSITLKAVMVDCTAEPREIWPEVKAKIGSTDPASKVQVMADPDPKVVVPISVVSKFRVSVSVAEATVSMPLVPPAMVKVSPPEIVWDVPLSPAAVNVPPDAAHCQMAEEALQDKTCKSEQPPKSLRPSDDTSRPELAEVVVVVEVVVASMATVTVSVAAAVVVVPEPAAMVMVSPSDIV